MDFELSADQRAFQASAKAFAEKELKPCAAEWDETGFFPKDVIARGGASGFCGIYCPEEWGGTNLTRLDAAIIFEEMAAADPSTTAYFSIHNMVAWMVSTWATDAVRSAWCSALISGAKLGSYCLTEPGSGSDAASLSTKAVWDGGGYLITGSKSFISGAGESDLLVVMARTGVAGPKGISAFAVPAKADGITYGRKEHKLGWNSQPTRGLTFQDVRVPADHLLGAEGEGFRIAMKGLDGGRVNIGACSVGAAQGALDAARRYMGERRQFGKPLGEFQALQFKLADMATELVAARQMVRMAACRLQSKAPDATIYCAMAKRFATDVGFKVCNEALQIHGGYGYIREYPVERLMRDARAHQIIEGTNEIMRLIVARRLLEPDSSLDLR